MAASKFEKDFHPESKAYFQLMEERGSLGNLSSPDVTVEMIRDFFRNVWKSGRGVVEYDGKREELFVPSEEVKGGIPLYVYKPRSLSSDPTILIYFHGGGNIFGSRKEVEDTCKILSRQAECIVLNVEYRLAPEHKVPAMMDDAVAVTQWVLANRKSLGGTENSKVGVSGDSAGGLLSASVSNEVPGVAFQILIYPLLSGATHDSPSFREFAGERFADMEFMLWMESLVVDKKEDLDIPRYHMLGHQKYDHLPPTLCIVAELDQMRDESYEYSRRLTAAGVESEVFLAKGAVHGYYTNPGVFPELCRESYAKAVEFMNKLRPRTT